MNTILVWGRPNSLNVQKVLWCLEETECKYKFILTGGEYGGTHDDLFLAKNPNGLVPVIEDGECVLWESNTIVRYLTARRYGQVWCMSG